MGNAISAATSLFALLLLLGFALPVPRWRTGEHAMPPLEYRGAVLPLLRSEDLLWTDTDAACGRGRPRAPDDCPALAAPVAGLSTAMM